MRASPTIRFLIRILRLVLWRLDPGYELGSDRQGEGKRIPFITQLELMTDFENQFRLVVDPTLSG